MGNQTAPTGYEPYAAPYGDQYATQQGHQVYDSSFPPSKVSSSHETIPWLLNPRRFKYEREVEAFLRRTAAPPTGQSDERRHGRHSPSPASSTASAPRHDDRKGHRAYHDSRHDSVRTRRSRTRSRSRSLQRKKQYNRSRSNSRDEGVKKKKPMASTRDKR